MAAGQTRGLRVFRVSRTQSTRSGYPTGSGSTCSLRVAIGSLQKPPSDCRPSTGDHASWRADGCSGMALAQIAESGVERLTFTDVRNVDLSRPCTSVLDP